MFNLFYAYETVFDNRVNNLFSLNRKDSITVTGITKDLTDNKTNTSYDHIFQNNCRPTGCNIIKNFNHDNLFPYNLKPVLSDTKIKYINMSNCMHVISGALRNYVTNSGSSYWL